VGKEHVQVHSQREDATTGESSRQVRVGRDVMRVAGGLNTPDTAPSKDTKPQEEKKTDPFRSYLQKTASELFGVPGQMLDFVVGAAGTGVLGASGWSVVGSNTEIFVDPISLLGGAFQSVSKFNGNIAGKAVGASAGLALGIGAVFGKTTVDHGTVASLNYGPVIDIQRGNRVVWRGAPLTPLAAVGSLAVNILAMGINVATPVAADNLKWGVSMEVVKQLLLGLLVGKEAALSYVAAAQAANLESQKWSQLASADLANAKSMMGLGSLAKLEAEEGVLSAAEALKRAREALTEAANSSSQLRQSERAFEGDVDTSELRVGNFGVHADNINLVVHGRDQVLGRVLEKVRHSERWTPTATFIPTVALSAGAGAVEVNATDAIMINADQAKVHLDQAGIAVAPEKTSPVEFIGVLEKDARMIIEGNKLKLGTGDGEVTGYAGITIASSTIAGARAQPYPGRLIVGFELNSQKLRLYHGETVIELSSRGVAIKAAQLELHGDVVISKRAPLSKQKVSGINKDQVSLSIRK
jgi:hypothetical protein